MKFSESFGKRRFGFGFYTVIALCLLLIGGASWFALSNLNDDEKVSSVPNTSSQEEYKDKTSSYTETVPQNPIVSTPAEDVENKVSKEPYTSTETKITKETLVAFSMPVEGEILKDYSEKNLQYSSTYQDMRLHYGVDIACKTETPIYACADGTVTDISTNTEFGTVVTIEHPKGITIKYASLKDIKIKKNDKIKMGETIGNSTTVPAECNDKAHIHIEVYKNGKHVSPLEALGLN